MAPKASARDFVPNATRKIRAGRPDGIGLPKKGNVNSSSTNGKLHVDTKPAFPQVVFGNILDYKVSPYDLVDGVYFDVAPSPYDGKRRTPGAPKTPAPAKPVPTSLRRRKAPPAGTRPTFFSSKVRAA